MLRTVVDALPMAPGGAAGTAWDVLLRGAMIASEWCFMLGMSAIGLQTRLSALRQIGLKPLALGFVAALSVAAVSASAVLL